jgi:hypothetical protein
VLYSTGNQNSGLSLFIQSDRLVFHYNCFGRVEILFVMLIILSIGPSVGFDHGSPVSRRYASPYPFEGKLSRVDIMIVPRTLPPAGPDAAEVPPRCRRR